MPLSLRCHRCWRSIDEPSALVFGPPDQGKVVKCHVCIQCWNVALFPWLDCQVDMPKARPSREGDSLK